MIHRVFPQQTFSWAVSISTQLLHTHQEGLGVPFGLGFESGSSWPERRRLRARSTPPWPHRIRVHKRCNCSVERPATKVCNNIKLIAVIFTSELCSDNSYFHLSKLLLKWKCLPGLTSKLVLAWLSFASSTLTPFCALSSSSLHGHLPTLWQVFLQSHLTCHIKQVHKCDHREAELQVPCLLTTCSSADLQAPEGPATQTEAIVYNNKPLHVAKVQRTRSHNHK